MSKNVLACFYDDVGQAVVSYQIFPSFGDFYRSLVKASFDETLPFCMFPADYSVSVVGTLEDGEFLKPQQEFCFSFDVIKKCGKGMDPKVNFNTSLFVQRLFNGVDSDDKD